MASSTIKLVRDLHLKNIAEAMELLRAAGFDVDVEGFGPISIIDDETVARVKQLHEQDLDREELEALAASARAVGTKADLATLAVSLAEYTSSALEAVRQPSVSVVEMRLLGTRLCDEIESFRQRLMKKRLPGLRALDYAELMRLSGELLEAYPRWQEFSEPKGEDLEAVGDLSVLQREAVKEKPKKKRTRNRHDYGGYGGSGRW